MISYISPPRENKRREIYQIASIKLETGETKKTYLVKKYRNFANWQPYLSVGTILKGLVMKGDEIDADSPIEKIGFQETVIKKPEAEPVKDGCPHPMTRPTIDPDYLFCLKCKSPFKKL